MNWNTQTERRHETYLQSQIDQEKKINNPQSFES